MQCEVQQFNVFIYEEEIIHCRASESPQLINLCRTSVISLLRMIDFLLITEGRKMIKN